MNVSCTIADWCSELKARIEDVKKLIWWGMAALTAIGVALSGCGSSNNNTANVRVANATITHPSLDLYVNGGLAIPATATDTVSAYATASSGGTTLQLSDAGSGNALNAIVPTLASSDHYTLLAYESSGAVKAIVLTEDYAAPAVGVATLRLYDAAIEAGALDLYITTNACNNLSALAPTTSFPVLTSPGAALFSEGAGTYNVCATGTGNKADLRMSMSVTLASQQVATLAVTPAAGGLLLNGSLVIQQGAYTATRNTSTRVRLASAVSGNALVSAFAGNVELDGGTTAAPGDVSPAFDYYVLVPSASSLNISVNGASVGAPATPLAVGGDMTLLVYGNPGNATASLIIDDNRPPVDPTTVKLRIINGVNGSTGSLTLTANSTPVANGIQSGTASAYVAVPGSANPMALNLYSSASPGTYVSLTTPLNSNSVYSVMAGGPFAAPQLLIR
jgi:hypothetical protein